MKTIPIARPGSGPAPTPDASVQKAADAKARAISILTGQSSAQQNAPQQNHQTPIPVNANAISPEDMSAVQTPSLHNNSTVEEQSDSEDHSAVTHDEIRQASKPTEVQEKSEGLSDSQVAILARKERAFRAKTQQQEQALKAERSQWQSEKARLEQRLQELETGYIPKSQLKQHALEALSRGELSYDEITQEVMNPIDQRTASMLKRLENQVTDLQTKLDNAAKGARDASDHQYQAALKQIRSDVNSLVKVDSSFEMIKATRSEADVVDLIEATYKEDGYVMTVEEAAAEVENYLTEEASKLARLEKIKKRISPPAPTAVKKVEGQTGDTQTPRQTQQTQMKTLTNANSGSRKLSSRERAMLAFKGEKF